MQTEAKDELVRMSSLLCEQNLRELGAFFE